MRGESITRFHSYCNMSLHNTDERRVHNTCEGPLHDIHRRSRPICKHKNHPSWATQASHASGQSRKHHMLRASEMGDVRIYTEPSPEPMRESELSEPSSDAASDARKSASSISSRSMAGMGAASASSSVVAAAEHKAISQSISSHSISRSIIQSISPRSGRRELRTLGIEASALLRSAVLACHRRRIAAHGHQGRAHNVAISRMSTQHLGCALARGRRAPAPTPTQPARGADGAQHCPA